VPARVAGAQPAQLGREQQPARLDEGVDGDRGRAEPGDVQGKGVRPTGAQRRRAQREQLEVEVEQVERVVAVSADLADVGRQPDVAADQRDHREREEQQPQQRNGRRPGQLPETTGRRATTRHASIVSTEADRSGGQA
jgi:hypothetical protein